MKFSIFKLEQLTALHVGTKNDTYDSSNNLLESDTISAALAAMYAQNGANADEVLALLEGLTLSSAFPYIGDLFFLPVPAGDIALDFGKDGETAHRKALKKVKFAEQSVWNRLIKGEKLVLMQDVVYFGEFLLPASTKQFKTPFAKQVNQRVNVSRGDDSNDTLPFFFEWMYFAENAGLYFIVDAPGVDKALLESLVEQLGQTGVGTDKSVGGGQFVSVPATLNLDLPAQSDDVLLLSNYIPLKDELMQIDLNESMYQLIKRTGFIAGSSQTHLRHLRRKTIHLLEMGSVLKMKESYKIQGKVVNLRPAWNSDELHPIYRSGKALCFPIKR